VYFYVLNLIKMKALKKVLLVLLMAFVVGQFFGPEKNEGDLASIDAFLA